MIPGTRMFDGDVWRLPQMLFGFREPVGRRRYFVVGAFLTFVKYVLEQRFFSMYGADLNLRSFVTPIIFRDPALYGGGNSRLMIMASALIALPFLWIGFSLSARRAMDARRSPLWGLLFFLPGVQLLAAAVLCTLPTRAVDPGAPPQLGTYRTAPRAAGLPTRVTAEAPPTLAHALQASVLGLLLGAAIYVGGESLWNAHLGAPASLPSAVLGSVAIAATALAGSLTNARKHDRLHAGEAWRSIRLTALVMAGAFAFWTVLYRLLPSVQQDWRWLVYLVGGGSVLAAAGLAVVRSAFGFVGLADHQAVEVAPAVRIEGVGAIAPPNDTTTEEDGEGEPSEDENVHVSRVEGKR